MTPSTEELRRLLAEATRLPWHQEAWDKRNIRVDDFDLSTIGRFGHEKNAAITVAAVNALPALPGLLDRLDAAERLLKIAFDEGNAQMGFVEAAEAENARLRAVNERLVAWVGGVADQLIGSEIIEGDEEWADYREGFETIVLAGRAFIADIKKETADD